VANELSARQADDFFGLPRLQWQLDFGAATAREGEDHDFALTPSREDGP
jgi:hypothetical protein